jgi:geranylgeranyl pyrophosphate synthase
LVFLAGGAVGMGSSDELLRRCAAAVEMVHCYSLVHDDLPAMDDDVLRRGMPTAHVKFGQAMAILAGDALLTRAFGVLAMSGDERSAVLSAQLSRAAGGAGMIAGQVGDMELCTLPKGLAGLEYVHSRKTGALIAASVRMGAICGRADKTTLTRLGKFGNILGLVFQVVDDVLDVTGKTHKIGKTPGKDSRHGKNTYISQLGLDEARRLSRKLTDQAIACLDFLGPKGDKLRLLTGLLAARTS